MADDEKVERTLQCWWVFLLILPIVGGVVGLILLALFLWYFGVKLSFLFL